ncbi:hypothetical protein, partial [Mesorhizobium sp. 128a]
MIPENTEISPEMWAFVRELTGLSPSPNDPMDMAGPIELPAHDFLATDEDMADGMPLQQYLSSAELSEQAGQQGHVWPPAAPLQAFAGP